MRYQSTLFEAYRDIVSPMTTLNKFTVLAVDDDPEIRSLIASYLGSQGIVVVEASSETQMRCQISTCKPAVILLDVNLGPEDGFSIARRLRQSWQGGLIMFTGRGDTIDRVVGLEIGADDYITKPFELRELLARVRSVSRRSNRSFNAETSPTLILPTEVSRLCFDQFVLNLKARELRTDLGETVHLTTGEFNLLVALVENSGRVQSRDSLIRLTHHREAGPFDRTIDVQIGRLRKKLGDIAEPYKLIKSVRSLGYLFTPEVHKEY